MSFKVFVLLSIIIVCAVFAYIKTQSLGSEDSLFNQTTRISLARHPFLRGLFSLHNDGDARAEFLSGNSNIILEIVQASGSPLPDRVINDFAAKIHTITGRGVDIYNLDTIENTEISDADLKEIANIKRRHANLGQPNLFVVYTANFSSKINDIGKTYQEYGLVLSHNRMTALAGQGGPALEQYQLSTLMHEFGHQLGLPHNDKTDCIMYKNLEVQQGALSYGGIYAVTDYCQFELNQLDTIKDSLK